MGGESATQRKPISAYPVRAPKPVGQYIANIYKDRISQFYAKGQWENNNLNAMMFEGVASGEPHVELSVWDAPGQDRPTFDEAVKHEFRKTEVGAWFGPAWSTHWFKVILTVPKDLRDKRLLELHWDANNEGMVWTHDGKPLQGLTGGGERTEWILPDSFRDGKEHTIYIEMACNGMFGAAKGGDIIQPPAPNKHFRLDKAEIVAVNPDARQLYIDIWIIGDAAREFPSESWEQHQALKTCNEIIEAFELGNKDSLKKCREIAQQYLGPDVDSARVYDTKKGKQPLVFGIGHCHIDSCWLWPWDETKRKVARSWSNQCDLMDRYPELNFACSQAQQYKWCKQLYPHVWERVKRKVSEGRFHPIGGSWVEHDTNMPSGESLVRQFLYGQRFFESNFGKRSQTFWLPDTFGYSSQLPQLCRLSGMTRFLTQKLSWNNINKFPHTTFNWVALDGTQVICHMPPSETYTAEAHFSDVKRSMSQHKSLDQDHTSLLVFGKGDGGGGPTWQHLEKLRRCRGISDTVGLLPRVSLGGSVDDFFDSLERKADSLVTWFGELYFELHRGTYTTQANNKKFNRKAEFVLRDIEQLATIASLKEKDYKYPKKEIDEMWEATLLCQFHDCLPGSSIEMCYDDSDKLYAQIFKTGAKLLKDACKALSVFEVETTSMERGITLNTLPWYREELVEISKGEFGLAKGVGPLLKLQQYEIRQEEDGVKLHKQSNGVFVLENKRLKVRVEAGTITSLYDKYDRREIIPEGQRANQFVLFDDKPLYWQAWDVEVYHLDTRKELQSSETQVHEEKSHRVSVITKTKISDESHISTIISLSAAVNELQSYVEVQSTVEWHETMKFLKVEFPVDIRNTEASYETAFGIVRRPTHYNTSWDMAKFEVCCHKFADLSEHGYGVSILNDSKYGFATTGSLMRLSLLRSSKAPDAHADMGSHTIRWAIFPHTGSLGAMTVRKAYEFNNPLKLLESPHDFAALDEQEPPVWFTDNSNPSLILDTIKRAEDDEDVSVEEDESPLKKKKGQSVILRIYDSLGGRARGTIETRWPVKRVSKVNLLEDEVEEVTGFDVAEGRFEVDLRPFEVASYRLELA
ncbi:glycosyl hydrolases family 38 N-terminal domain-containing protein [Pseudoneurospora amorphoporcata]|uniref:Alpha-mannosidase n=1 Tax=Pseudoneurospora amorphoporcata TaxID=241081 RepID=A0AAN6NY26_9PEZI|nr:glycosyl hydrolases family 38 N-terminal domain-containing protein [Pseudoneurospora amorphoporcata]